MPQTLQLIKSVSGGTASATDWELSADGPTPISGAGGVGPSSVTAGTYDLSETGFPGIAWDSLTQSWQSDNNTWGGNYGQGVWVCTGGTQTDDDTVIVGTGETVVCTIVNTFIAAPPPDCPTIYVAVVDPPAPPAATAPGISCAAPSVPGYTPINTIYDEPSERLGS